MWALNPYSTITKKNRRWGSRTVATAKYTKKVNVFDGANSYEFNVCELSGSNYIIAYAVVCDNYN